MKRTRHAEVRDNKRSIVADEDIGWLEISVDHTVSVNVMKTRQNLLHKDSRDANVQASSSTGFRLTDDVRQIRLGQRELHEDATQVVVHVQQPNNVLVRWQRLQNCRLAHFDRPYPVLVKRHVF